MSRIEAQWTSRSWVLGARIRPQSGAGAVCLCAHTPAQNRQGAPGPLEAPWTPGTPGRQRGARRPSPPLALPARWGLPNPVAPSCLPAAAVVCQTGRWLMNMSHGSILRLAVFKQLRGCRCRLRHRSETADAHPGPRASQAEADGRHGPGLLSSTRCLCRRGLPRRSRPSRGGGSQAGAEGLAGLPCLALQLVGGVLTAPGLGNEL